MLAALSIWHCLWQPLLHDVRRASPHNLNIVLYIITLSFIRREELYLSPRFALFDEIGLMDHKADRQVPLRTHKGSLQ
jgi:hypothetical protein